MKILENCCLILIGFSIGFLCLMIIMYYLPYKTPTYKLGQIDALTGNIRYELIIDDSQELKWAYKK